MLDTLFWLVVGAFIGWNFPQPQFAKTVFEKVMGFFKTKQSLYESRVMKIVAVILFCLLVTVALAQSTPPAKSTSRTINKELLCDNAEKVLGVLLNELKEEPIWVGTQMTESGSKYMYTLMVNETSGEWSLLQYTSETACFIGVGSKSTLMKHNKKQYYIRG